LASDGSSYTITTETRKGEHYIYTVSNLTVLNADSGDAGQYNCSASNNINNLIDAISSGIGEIFVQTSGKLFNMSPGFVSKN